MVNMVRMERSFNTGYIFFLIFKTNQTFQKNMEEVYFKID